MSSIAKVTAIPCRFAKDESYLGSHDIPAGAPAYFRRSHVRAVYSRYFETTFVKLQADDGTVGFGECLAPVAPRVSAAIIEDLFAEELVGNDPMRITAIRSGLYDMMRDRGYTGGFYIDALTAVDTALWDLKGKLLGQSVTSLLGGSFVDAVPAYVSSIGGVTDEEKADRIEYWMGLGFANFKHHGGRGIESDVQTVRAIRNAAGPDATVGYDAHWVYSPGEAARLARKLADYDTAFLEAPMNPESVEAHARLAQQSPVPVAVGENIRTRHEYLQWLVQGAASILQPDVGRSGISETVALAQMAEPFAVQIAPHLSVGLGPMVAASIHVAASISNLYLLEYQPPTMELANMLLEGDGIVAEKGVYRIPDRPGLGIDVSEARIYEKQV